MALKYNLDPTEIEMIKTKFSAYRELQDRKKELSEEEKSIKQDVAHIIEGKIKDANLLLKSLHQQWKNGENDLDEVGSVMESIKANGGPIDDDE